MPARNRGRSPDSVVSSASFRPPPRRAASCTSFRPQERRAAEFHFQGRFGFSLHHDPNSKILQLLETSDLAAMRKLREQCWDGINIKQGIDTWRFRRLEAHIAKLQRTTPERSASEVKPAGDRRTVSFSQPVRRGSSASASFPRRENGSFPKRENASNDFAQGLSMNSASDRIHVVSFT
eukprot:TRINITY_DN111110_c0_g1_i1.p1 TRINITY_DN111110_c0_g1~~TRINITY_DN111110_c0_g1_i1.p1  ORF type:complete len:179 (-),score=12.26 TRINITY_DN111110_c0_g1_i1:42-578(-)